MRADVHRDTLGVCAQQQVRTHITSKHTHTPWLSMTTTLLSSSLLYLPLQLIPVQPSLHLHFSPSSRWGRSRPSGKAPQTKSKTKKRKKKGTLKYGWRERQVNTQGPSLFCLPVPHAGFQLEQERAQSNKNNQLKGWW